MKFYQWLRYTLYEHDLNIDHMELAYTIREMQVKDYDRYGYQSEYPFRQLHENTSVARVPYYGISKDRVLEMTSVTDIELKPKNGFKSTLWRVWHSLFPTPQTVDKGWAIKYIQGKQNIAYRLNLELMQIGLKFPYYDLRLYIAYDAELDKLYYFEPVHKL